MAKATVGATILEEVTEFKKVPSTIKLEISYEEAFALRSVLGKIAGSGFFRKNLDSVSDALRNVGVMGSWGLGYTEFEPDDHNVNLHELIASNWYVEEPDEEQQALIDKIIRRNKAKGATSGCTTK